MSEEENKVLFEIQNKEKVKKILQRYPDKKSAVNPLLHLVQEENNGWIPEICVPTIVSLTGANTRTVFENMHFYKMYNLKPVRGKFHVIVCTSFCCGSEEVKSAVEKYLKIKIGETTKDKVFSLFESGECLGSCCDSPVVIIARFNDENSSYNYYMGVNAKNVVEVLKDLKNGGVPKTTKFKKFQRTTLKK